MEQFNPSGYIKTPKDEYQNAYNSKDDYLENVFEYCIQDHNGDIWVPTFGKYLELESQKLELEARAE